MPGMPVAEKMTAEEFIRLQAQRPDERLELIEGEVVVTEPTAHHGRIQINLLLAVENWARAQPGRGQTLVPIDVDVAEHNVFQPDLSWYRQERALSADQPPPYVMPDLAVEVRSPSTWRYVVGAKKARYESRGLPELWLADTLSRTVLVYRRSRPSAPAYDVALELTVDEELSSPLLPGFSLAVAEVFRLP
jgi:Uma2 family endonuclease